MLYLVNEMEENTPKLLNNNSQEAAELLGFSSSDSLDSPSLSNFQAPKPKRKVRFKKPFRSYSRMKSARNPPPKSCNCHAIEGIKVLSILIMLAIVGALLWYVTSLSQRIQELQNKFTDIEAGNRNTPEALHLTYAKLRLVDANITVLFSEVKRNLANIDNITLELKHLKDVTSNLMESVAAAPALQELPKNVKALSESVVSFGSKMVALESNIKELKDQQSTAQTNTQSLSRELDSLKLVMQELSNSTDLQSQLNRTALLQSTQHNVQELTEKLSSLSQSISVMNVTLVDLPAKVKTTEEIIHNDTHSLWSVVHILEDFLQKNLTLRVEHLEYEAELCASSNFSSNSSSVNKTFEQIPTSHLLSESNATDVVRHLLQQTLEEMTTATDQKLQALDASLKKLISCCKGSRDQSATTTTNAPLTVRPSSSADTSTLSLSPVV